MAAVTISSDFGTQENNVYHWMVLIKFFSKHLEGIIINKDVDFDKLEHYNYSKISSIVTHIKTTTTTKKVPWLNVSPATTAILCDPFWADDLKPLKPTGFQSSFSWCTQYTPISRLACTILLLVVWPALQRSSRYVQWQLSALSHLNKAAFHTSL